MIPNSFLDELVPMHLVLSPAGKIEHAGPPITKMAGAMVVIGQEFRSVFGLKAPFDETEFEALIAKPGRLLAPYLLSYPEHPMKGVFVPLPDGSGVILNLSLGLSFASAVRTFELNLGDLSPCDPTVELLYLNEANRAAKDLSQRLTERLQSAREAADQKAKTDVLTGLLNRRAIDEELARLISKGDKDFTLLHLDLDWFKEVNDTYGHAAGDAVLVRLADVFAAVLREDDRAARIGGDEFLVVLIGDLPPDKAAGVASRLIRQIEERIEFEGHDLRVSASIGIVNTANYPSGVSVKDLLADADRALYQAKNDGRGRFKLHESWQSVQFTRAG